MTAKSRSTAQPDPEAKYFAEASTDAGQHFEVKVAAYPEPRFGAELSPKGRNALSITMVVEAAIVALLAYGDFLLAGTPLTTLGACVLGAIAVACFWAVYATTRERDSWLKSSLISQASVVALAAYVSYLDHVSHDRQINGIAGCAILIGAVAVGWTIFLVTRAHGPIPAGFKSIAAVIPLVGFLQYWMQTDYVPRTTAPLVDVSTDLIATGTSGDTVQLTAKVTFNNRGTVPVYVAGSVMRITAYTTGSGKPIQISDAFDEESTAQPREYRADPWSLDDSVLLYANDIFRAGKSLNASQSTTIRKAVDFDGRRYRSARFAVDAIFLNKESVDHASACRLPPIPSGGGETNSGDILKVNKVDGKEYLCREVQMRPTNIVHKLVGDRQSVTIETVFRENNRPSASYPTLVSTVAGGSALNPPTLTYKNIVTEYIPSKDPRAPGPDTAGPH